MNTPNPLIGAIACASLAYDNISQAFSAWPDLFGMFFGVMLSIFWCYMTKGYLEEYEKDPMV